MWGISLLLNTFIWWMIESWLNVITHSLYFLFWREVAEIRAQELEPVESLAWREAGNQDLVINMRNAGKAFFFCDTTSLLDCSRRFDHSDDSVLRQT